jgi:Flp pilus assembly protein TadD
LRRALASVVVLAVASCSAPPAHAVSEQVPIGARAIAMGGAYSSLAEDASALFWNPAGLVRVGHQEISGSHANLFRTDILDNVASFVLPLSPDRAAGVDWYHSGFDDGELGFFENRVSAAFATRLHAGLWAGATAKWLSRSTALDGLNLRDAHGFGMDFGLLASPLERVHVGLVAQDAMGTRVRANDGTSDLAYPRNMRFGASYAWKRWGTAAFDVDDRWHLGLEGTPLAQLALRLGTEHDRHGSEPATWTYGVGLAAGILRLDWAHVEPPTLDPTDHFSVAMAFNFNPAQVRLEKVQAREVYTSLYKSYAREPLGSVQVRNLQDRPLETRLSVFIPELMTAPSEQPLILRPKATVEVPLTAVLDERVLAQRGDRPVQVQVGASYQSRRLERKERTSARTIAYAPGAIDWSAGMAQAAAYVTPRDPSVDALAREAGRLVAQREAGAFGSRNVSFAAAVTDALAELGVTYVPDPVNPFTTVAETAHAVDTVHYPYQTLETRSGDCDDTTVLIASLLGNVGVATRFVDAPGHIFLVYDTGLHERNRPALGVDSSMTVVIDHEVWAPLETTALSKGFVEAWRMGADEVASWSARGQIGYVDVADAQARYEPVLPPGERKPPVVDAGRLEQRLAASQAKLSSMRDEYFAAHFGGVARDLEASADALAEIARVEYLGGDLEGARAQLSEALRKAPHSVVIHNDLGVVLAGLDSLDEAEDHWRTALALGGRQPGIGLNLAIARWARGDSLSGREMMGRAVSEAGGYEAACQLIGLAASDSLDRASAETAGPEAARRWLRATIRGSMAAAGRTAAPRPPQPAPGQRPGGSRQLRYPEVSHYLHWIE